MDRRRSTDDGKWLCGHIRIHRWLASFAELRQNSLCLSSPACSEPTTVPSDIWCRNLSPSWRLRSSAHRNSVSSVSTTSTVVECEALRDANTSRWGSHVASACLTDSPNQILFIPATTSQVGRRSASILEQAASPKHTNVDFYWLTSGLPKQATFLRQVQEQGPTFCKANALYKDGIPWVSKLEPFSTPLTPWRRSQSNTLLPV